MRIRTKPWAKKELEECNFYINNPEINKGKWNEYFKNENPIHMELGCGKGSFIAELATQNLNINYIAVDMIEAMLGLAKRNIESKYNEKNIDEIKNIALVRQNIERIDMMLDKSDIIDRIYINFCNPWPRGKHNKRRLTHTRQLEKYKVFLREGAEIHFKTDDDTLFESSIKYFENSGFEILELTYDVHSENIEDNIETEHEKMFSEQGIKIKRLVANI